MGIAVLKKNISVRLILEKYLSIAVWSIFKKVK
jgi:hypothetical protein